jgi:hypothetical protein
MKHWMATAAAFALLTGVTAANAQNAPAAKTDTTVQTKTDTTAQTQSSGSTRTSMKHRSTKHAMRSHRLRPRASLKSQSRSTTGSGARTGTIGGPRNDPSIHQSIQRDSRGTPKGPGSDQNK